MNELKCWIRNYLGWPNPQTDKTKLNYDNLTPDLDVKLIVKMNRTGANNWSLTDVGFEYLGSNIFSTFETQSKEIISLNSTTSMIKVKLHVTYGVTVFNIPVQTHYYTFFFFTINRASGNVLQSGFTDE